MTAGPHSHTGHKWIETDRIIDRPVFDHDGEFIGKICRLLIERRSGVVQKVVVQTHGRFGLGHREVGLGWESLTYDTRLPGYRSTARKADILAQKSTDLTDEPEFP